MIKWKSKKLNILEQVNQITATNHNQIIYIKIINI